MRVRVDASCECWSHVRCALQGTVMRVRVRHDVCACAWHLQLLSWLGAVVCSKLHWIFSHEKHLQHTWNLHSVLARRHPEPAAVLVRRACLKYKQLSYDTCQTQTLVRCLWPTHTPSCAPTPGHLVHKFCTQSAPVADRSLKLPETEVMCKPWCCCGCCYCWCCYLSLQTWSKKICKAFFFALVTTTAEMFAHCAVN